MQKNLGMFEIDADISRKYNEQILIPVTDNQFIQFLGSMGIKKTFKGEMFYHIGMGMNRFFSRTPDFDLVATIDNRIYKIYCKFIDSDRSAAISFRAYVRKSLSEDMSPRQFSNPQITRIQNGQLTSWHDDWGNILLEEFGVMTSEGSAWSTAIALTSKTVKNAKKIGFLDTLFNRQ